MIYQVALLYLDLKEKDMHHGLLVSTSIYIDLETTYRVHLGSFAFAREFTSSIERGYIKRASIMTLKERDELVLRDIISRVNQSGSNPIIPDYTSFAQWAEKLRIMVCDKVGELF